MSKGGGSQRSTQTTEPWKVVQPYLGDLYARGSELSQTQQQFYPGQTFVGPNPLELQGQQAGLNFANQAFGGQQAPQYDLAAQAQNSLLSGQNPSGQLAGGVAPMALGQLGNVFGGGQNMIGQQQLNPSQFTPNLGPTPGFNPSQFTPNINPTVTQDPNAALGRMLSGQADYSGVQSATEAATRPIMEAFNNEFLPSLTSRTSLYNNPTGAIKSINAALPGIARSIGDVGSQFAWQERMRADQAQREGAQLATSAGLAQGGQGLQAAGLGLQGAGQAAGLGLQGMGLGLDAAQLGLQGAGQQAGLNLQTALANQQGQQAYRGDVLGLGNLAANLGGQQSQNMAQGLGLFGNTLQTGFTPSNVLGSAGQFQRGFGEAALNEDINRFNFNQQAPRDALNWFNSILQGTAGLGGTMTGTQSQTGGSGAGAASGLGGLLMLGSLFGGGGGGKGGGKGGGGGGGGPGVFGGGA